MKNTAVKNWTFRKKERVVTVTNGQSEELELPSTFEYELICPPAALFDPSGLLRVADKAKLTDALVFASSQETDVGGTLSLSLSLSLSPHLALKLLLKMWCSSAIASCIVGQNVVRVENMDVSVP